ncbi:hypothetical protein [Microvirga pudoricolor]|uniref:hypothetical protein n=1 Tax=Microvirga pudoricolor TaxID=2778729 RepID=UPI00194DCC2A|nr:hypothetical protein [Microvirga pudoricolor]MBM6593021.1 hypothetical protein [Microvirga pudoricolor]
MAFTRIQYGLVYGLIAVTGIEFFYRSQEFVALLFVFSVLCAMIYGITLRVRPLRLILAFFALEMAQALYFDNLVVGSLITLIVKLSTVYVIVQICGKSFPRYYVNVMYVIASIALPIYFLTFIPSVESFLIQDLAIIFFRPVFSVGESLYEHNPNIIIYTFNPFARGAVLRNSGPFWEPGGFAVFLNFALIFNIARQRKLLERKNIVFVVSVVSTFSTAGYISLFIIIVGYLMTNDAITAVLRVCCALALLLCATLAYSDIGFLGDKIDQNISLTKEDNTSRFGSAYFDVLDTVKSPWIGFGRLAENRFGELAKALDPSIHRNNGVTYLAVTYGIPAAIAYFAILFKFLLRYCRAAGISSWFAVYAFAAILSAGFSQVIFDRALPLSFLFLADCFRFQEVRHPPLSAVRSAKS